MAETVLVTGGSGYVACHLIQQLLTAGSRVHTTVRSLGNAAKLQQHPGKQSLPLGQDHSRKGSLGHLCPPGSLDTGDDQPRLILGPSLTPASDSGSLFLLDEMFRGYFFYGMPDLNITTVDVREVAQAHIAAACNRSAQGRYILAEKRMLFFAEVARIVRPHHRRPGRGPPTACPTG